jgi:hypothetical protein
MSNQQQPEQAPEFSPQSVRQIELHHELYRRDPARASALSAAAFCGT